MGVQNHEPARDPQDLERLLIERQHAGDVEGMLALFAPDAVVNTADGQIRRGHAAIRVFFEDYCASGRKFRMGEQRPAVINGDLALTSTKSPDGTVTAEVARRQPDGIWLWTIDKYVNG